MAETPLADSLSVANRQAQLQPLTEPEQIATLLQQHLHIGPADVEPNCTSIAYEKPSDAETTLAFEELQTVFDAGVHKGAQFLVVGEVPPSDFVDVARFFSGPMYAGQRTPIPIHAVTKDSLSGALPTRGDTDIFEVSESRPPQPVQETPMALSSSPASGTAFQSTQSSPSDSHTDHLHELASRTAQHLGSRIRSREEVLINQCRISILTADVFVRQDVEPLLSLIGTIRGILSGGIGIGAHYLSVATDSRIVNRLESEVTGIVELRTTDATEMRFRFTDGPALGVTPWYRVNDLVLPDG